MKNTFELALEELGYTKEEFLKVAVSCLKMKADKWGRDAIDANDFKAVVHYEMLRIACEEYDPDEAEE